MPPILEAMVVTKLDLRKKLKGLYAPPEGEVELVEVPPMKYIMMDGTGEPGGKEFQQAMATVYALAYTVKFTAKAHLKKDYGVMAPEALWWTREGTFDRVGPKDWLWTLMLVQPDFVSTKLFSKAVEELRRKKDPLGLGMAHLTTFDEGLCVQVMHVGPYSAERKSIARLEAFAEKHWYRLVGKHHEIYLGDPRRSAPARLRTIVRRQVVRAL